MTRKQIARAYNKLWQHCTRDDGYQPYGYDWPTIRITMPGLVAAIMRLQALHNVATD